MLRFRLPLLRKMRGWRKESIEEMQHADKIIERIIFLDGAPNMQTLEALHIGQTVKQLAVAIALRSPICDDDANGPLPGMAGS